MNHVWFLSEIQPQLAIAGEQDWLSAAAKPHLAGMVPSRELAWEIENVKDGFLDNGMLKLEGFKGDIIQEETHGDNLFNAEDNSTNEMILNIRLLLIQNKMRIDGLRR